MEFLRNAHFNHDFAYISIGGFCQFFVEIGHQLEEAKIQTASNIEFTVLEQKKGWHLLV